MLCGLALFTANPAPALAAEIPTQKMIYDVYAGGFHVVQADVTIDYSKKGRYEIFLGAQTYGFLGKVAPWSGTFESNGWVVGDDLKPQLHRSSAIWRGEEEIKSYNYTKDGGFQNLVIKEHDKPEETPDVDPALTKGTTDAFTAALLVFQNVAKGEACTGVSEVFDGKRRFEQIFAEQETEQLEATKYNIYTGPAVACTVEIKPVAGEWHKKPRGWMSIQEQGRARGMMPTIWLAQMKENAPAVPIKIRVKTAYGTLFMHLAHYESGEDIRIAEKRRN